MREQLEIISDYFSKHEKYADISISNIVDGITRSYDIYDLYFGIRVEDYNSLECFLSCEELVQGYAPQFFAATSRKEYPTILRKNKDSSNMYYDVLDNDTKCFEITSDTLYAKNGCREMVSFKSILEDNNLVMKKVRN